MQKTVSSRAPSFIPFAFGETTSISDELSVKREDLTTAPVYDLQGRRVSDSRLSKGIYIVNGDKIVIK